MPTSFLDVVRDRLEALAARLQGEARSMLDEALTPKTGVRGASSPGFPCTWPTGALRSFWR